MNNKGYMSISEFAKISGTTRRNLLFYDEIGLFFPDAVGENGYRYYTNQQFYTMDTINLLKSVGTPLKEIKEFLQNRNPQKALDLFSKQEKDIVDKIEKLTYYHGILQAYIERINKSVKFALNKPILEQQQTEYYLVSEKFEDAEDLNSAKVYFNFLSTLDKHRLGVCYPMGIIYRISGPMHDLSVQGYQMILRIDEKEARENKDIRILTKPSGYYLTEYRSGEGVASEILSDTMKKYIEDNDLKTIGSVWEFWWQDNIATRRPEEYIYQTSINVCV